MRSILVVSMVMCAWAATAEDKTVDLVVNGVPWAKTVITPYDGTSKESRDATFKVYTQVMDFAGAGKEPITKGLGGKFPHHRGMFIGWRETTVGGKKFDTWHMTDCYQQVVGTPNSDSNPVMQTLSIEWRGNDGTLILNESRTIRAQLGADGSHIFDFRSILTNSEADVNLRGDSHHAGMQIRLSNEVAEHEADTVYLLPEGAKRLDNDEVSGAPWVVCTAKINGKQYWVMHITPPANPAGVKLYSIRPYARFGSFSEPDVKKGEPLLLFYRIIVSEKEIDAAQAAALYNELLGPAQ